MEATATQLIRAATRPFISDLIPQFIEHLRVEERRSPQTLIRYQGHLTKLINVIGDCRVNTITSEKLSLYKRDLVDRGMGPATIATNISGIRSFLRYLRAVRGWKTYDPEKVKRPTIPQRPVSYLTQQEVSRFIEAIPSKTLAGIRDRALAEVLCATGMRISEAVSINRPDIDWEQKEARIVGKGRKERRVYFSDGALEAIRRYLRYRHDENLALFTTQGVDPVRLSPGGVWRQFRGYGRRAGIAKRIYPHMLRHTMATTLLANGCPIGHIRTLLGHGHLQTTCRYYLGVISDSEAKAAHTKYLRYESKKDENTRVEQPGQQNIAAGA
jgi:integrase/recombinase XerD